jgi:hypothetical protein
MPYKLRKDILIYRQASQPLHRAETSDARTTQVWDHGPARALYTRSPTGHVRMDPDMFDFYLEPEELNRIVWLARV